MNIFQHAVRDDDKEELWIKQLDQVESVYVAIPKGITTYSILFFPIGITPYSILIQSTVHYA
jgi:hypothetical protein